MIGDGDCGEIGRMKIGRGNRTTQRKPAPPPLCPSQIPGLNPGSRGGKPATNLLSYGAALESECYSLYKVSAAVCRDADKESSRTYLCLLLGRPAVESDISPALHSEVYIITVGSVLTIIYVSDGLLAARSLIYSGPRQVTGLVRLVKVSIYA
jgi:hypothetical protein